MTGKLRLMWPVLILGAFLTGCTGVSLCDYDLEANGWTSDTRTPLELLRRTDGVYRWYSNAEGDWLACPGGQRPGICSGTFTIYDRRDDGSFAKTLRVCET